MSRLAVGLRRQPELVVGGLAVALFVGLAAAEGGFVATTWYPATLFVGGLLLVTLMALGRAGRLRIASGNRVALALLAAFTAWTFLSMLWAEVPAAAWDGANRTLLYLLVFALFALLPWRASSAATLLGVYSVAIATLALVIVGDLASSADPELAILRGRLIEPTGYQNATAALFLASFFPALLLASRRETPWWARGVLLAAAGILLEAAILPQSRGAAIVLPLVAIAFLAIAPGRARVLLTALPVVLVAFLAREPLFDLYSIVVDGGDVRAGADEAFERIVVSALVLLAAGTVVGLAERAWRPSPALRRAGSRAVGAVATIAGVAGIVVALNATGNPTTWLDERWEDFKSGDPGQIEAETRFGGTLGSNRYDFWRVALDRFAEQPVAGLGMDQFEVEYIQGRRSTEEPANPHSLQVKILSQTGLVGAALFLGFLVATVAGALAARRRAGNTLGGVAAAGTLIAFTYWLVHGSADWFWEFPGLAAPALAWLAISASLPATGPEEPTPLRVGAPVLAAAGVVAVLATLSLVPPWGAARDVEIAARNWPANPDAAFDRLDRARDLNPLSDQPDSVAGTIAVRLGETDMARDRFAAAVERNDSSWYSLLMLGSLELADGDRKPALAHLRAAAELSPDEPLIDEALAGAREGEPVSPAAIDRSLAERVCVRIGRTEATPECE